MKKADIRRIVRAEIKVQKALNALNEIDINNLPSQVDVVELSYHRTSLEMLIQSFTRWQDSILHDEK